MLFRFIKALLSFKEYSSFIDFIISTHYSKFRQDYSRFLKVFFIDLILNSIIEFIMFHYIIISFIIGLYIQTAHFISRHVLSWLFNFFIFVWECYTYDQRFVFFEFIYLFVERYVLDFKYKLRIILYKYIIYGYFDFLDSIFFPVIEDAIYVYYKEKTIKHKEKEFEVVEMDDENYQILREEYDLNEKRDPYYYFFSGPDLKIYYPMRFALSSVMIRITGVILSISLLLIFLFFFINLFILTNLNIFELRQTFIDNGFYKIMENLFSYKDIYTKYFTDNKFFPYYNYTHMIQSPLYGKNIIGEPIVFWRNGLLITEENIIYGYIAENEYKYDNMTKYSFFKAALVLVYFVIKNSYFYFLYDLYVTYDFIEFERLRSLYLYFFYNFFFFLFIYILPIHLYYVIYHSYRIVSITKLLLKVVDFLKKPSKIFFNFSKIGVLKSYYVYRIIKDTPDWPIEYKENNIINNTINEKTSQVNLFFKEQKKLFDLKNNELNKKI